MREILFRGKRKLGNEWIEGSLHTEKFIEDKEFLCCEINQCDVFPETVGQYTGLTDKNGKKIFEGDILLDHYTEENCLIIYYEGGFEIYKNNISWHCQDCEMSDFEVIGNIHDNPELLKGGEK